MKKTFKDIISLFTSAIMIVSVVTASIVCASAEKYLPGDVDMNGVLDSSDALMIMRYSVGLIQLSKEQIEIADTNGDGMVDSNDALSVLQTAVFSSPEPSFTQEEEFALEVVRLCNKEREKAGLAPLKMNAELCEAAEVRVHELPQITNITNHKRPDGPDGSDWFTILRERGFNYILAGENSASAKNFTPKDVVREWMASESHKKNILCPEYNVTGVKYVFIENSTYGGYWDQIFACVTEDLQDENAEKQALLNKINAERKQKGLSALTMDNTLNSVAEVRATEITTKFDGKTRPDGTPWDEALYEKVDYYGTCRHYICRGNITGSADGAYNAFTANSNMTKTVFSANSYTKIGIGHVYVDGDKDAHYWTIVLTEDF